ncbi:hypothetical protein Tco_0053680 [Tanacetum coccineum]
MSMTILLSVKDKILATLSETSKYEYEIRYHPVRGMILASQSEAFKKENVLAEGFMVGNDEHSSHDKPHASDNSKEWNSGDDQLRFRWMIYPVVLADAVEGVRDAIGFDYHSSIWCAPFEDLHGRKCKSLVLWAEIGESSLTGPELVLDMTDKVVLIKEKLKSARDRQKSYVDKRRKPLEFEVGDRVLLKVSPWKGVRGTEFTWEHEDYMKSKYPQLFVNRADESAN